MHGFIVNLYVIIECTKGEKQAIQNIRLTTVEVDADQNCVDGVITGISGKVDLAFLEKYDIDFVACMPALHMFADDSVLKAGKCIMIADDGTAKLIGRLDDKKKD